MSSAGHVTAPSSPELAQTPQVEPPPHPRGQALESRWFLCSLSTTAVNQGLS